jgi:8-oxo-dGTP pyrophosphatase MutT (NUDIX family)
MNNEMINPWTTIVRQEKFDCDYYVAFKDMVTLGSGVPIPYTYVKMKKYGVAILPIANNGKGLLIGQYRYVLNRFTWEIVRGGGLLTTPPLESAKAELNEEAGIRAERWLHLFTSPASPGLTDEIAPSFLAWGLDHGLPDPGPTEKLSTRWIRFADLVGMALRGEIVDLASIATIFAVEARRVRRDLPSDLLRILNS